jgi:hypothetical protein
MNRPQIAILLLLCSATYAHSQSASTTRHSSASTTAPVTITVEDSVANLAPPATNSPTQSAPSSTANVAGKSDVKASPKAPVKTGRKSDKKATAKDVDPEKAAQTAKTAKIHMLLDRAYALTEQLSLQERFSVMNSLLDVAGREYPDKAVDWAIELWNTSKDLPAQTRMAAQSTVVNTIARVNPDKALDLLPLMDKPDETVTGVAWPSYAANIVFSEMRRKHGDSVIPKLQEVARSMSKDGGYPYAGMAGLIGRGWRDRDDDSESSPQNSEQAASIFRDALHAYQAAPAHANDQAFTQFLLIAHEAVPRELTIEAVDTLARNLMTAPADSSYSFNASIGDKQVSLQSRSDISLMRLMPLLKQLDPGMLAKVVEARPEFSGAEDGRMRSFGMTGPRNASAPTSPNTDSSRGRSRQNMRLARDPDQALAAAATMTDAGDKATLLAQTASFMARNSPEDAAKVLDEAQKVAAQVKDQMTELRIVVTSVRAARQLRQPQRVRELTARGFELGSDLVRQQMDEHPETNGQGEALGYMNSLVAFGMSDNPDSVTAVIDAIPYPLAKAMLYTTAARSVQFEGRFRGGFNGPMVGGNMGAIGETPSQRPPR